MQIKQLSLALSLLLTLCLFHDTQAQQAGRIESMKLLTPDVGWAATNKKLFWTTDGGASWKDITPKLNHKRQMVSSVFFLDASTGWVLLSCGDGRDLVVDDGCFELASTADAGGEKISVPFSEQQLEDGGGFSGRSWLEFVDSQHGWEILRIATGSGPPSAGEMLRTVDGGRTWVTTKDLPTPDRFHFINPKDGWLAGGDEGDLFATHDSGDSWQRVLLPDPTNLGPHANENYDLPLFENERRGFVAAQYSVGPSEGPSQSALVLFISDDGGRIWRQDRIMSGLPTINHSVIDDSTLFAAHSELLREPRIAGQGQCTATRTILSLYVVGPDRSPASSKTSLAVDGALTQLSFKGRERGWGNVSGRLFGTTDGGKAWTEITPDRAPPGPPPACATLKASPAQIKREAATGGLFRNDPASGTNVSSHLGFDITRVPCPTGLAKCSAAQSLTVMQAWMNSSPFYDTSVYLPGSPNRGTDLALTPAWVRGAQQQGWGFIPIWFGPQPPCSCYYVKNLCTQFPTVYSSDPSTDGAEAADSATASAQTLGLATPIIYTDVENYYGTPLCTPSQQTAAGQAVQAYVDGWDSEIHLKGYSAGAGVYANPAPITQDISATSTLPDDIWIAKTPAGGNPPQVTIWNQGIKDNLWPHTQRIHQFLIDQGGVTWGGTALSIDYDIDNATIAYANNGTKTYSWSYTQISYPGSTGTDVGGINDMWDTSFINGTGQVGEIVGSYTDANYNVHGFLLDGLVSFQSLDYPGGTFTSAIGINNSGSIVGQWVDTNGNSHGFLLDNASCSSFCSIDYPGSTFTDAIGINDAGQIVGEYMDTVNLLHGFLYYGSKFYSIDYPGGVDTEATGINGDGVIGGESQNSSTAPAFVENAVPPSWTGSFSAINYPGASATYAGSVNNDNLSASTIAKATSRDQFVRTVYFIPPQIH
jgi:photosystem II stability/assembly factor-like uncharacterized protein